MPVPPVADKIIRFYRSCVREQIDLSKVRYVINGDEALALAYAGMWFTPREVSGCFKPTMFHGVQLVVE